MGYERYPRNNDYRGDYDARDDYGDGRNRGYRGGGDRNYGSDRGSRYGGYDGRIGGYGDNNRYGTASGNDYRGSYAADGHRFTEVDRDDYRGGGWNSYGERPDLSRSGYSQGRYAPDRFDQGRYGASAGSRYGFGDTQRTPGREGYDYDERGFMARAGDEVLSWFGDDEAARRRQMDQRYDERLTREQGGRSDGDYDSWRRQQIDALDRDYDEYRRENQSKFHNEFSSWRTERQTQRSSLSRVSEHMEVVGSDGLHIGTVDKVRGDRIILTKNDENAGGHHHSIPSRWIQTVDDRVTIRKTAEEAMKHWKDEERSQAFFDDADQATANRQTARTYTGSY